jgi:hypothetical protein
MTQPNILPIFNAGKETYQVAHDWRVDFGDMHYTVPAGFITDGASVPRPLWMFYPPDGLHRAAAVAHDWLYKNKGFGKYSRAVADKLFFDLMIEFKVNPTKANVMWAGVRLGGWLPWMKSTGMAVIEPLRYIFE